MGSQEKLLTIKLLHIDRERKKPTQMDGTNTKARLEKTTREWTRAIDLL